MRIKITKDPGGYTASVVSTGIILSRSKELTKDFINDLNLAHNEELLLFPNADLSEALIEDVTKFISLAGIKLQE